jgi:aspartate dehydrogenase
VRLALIGFGGLGRIVADHLSLDNDVHVVAVAARSHQVHAVRALFPQARIVDSAAGLLDCAPELVVECASHGAFRQYAEPVLRAGIDLIAVSSGVLAEAPYREQVLRAGAESGASLEVPAGAIGAIDVIAAARTAGLDRVTYVTRKNAKAWRNTPAEEMVDLNSMREPKLFFDETAERAALIFTDKANVCATLALAGIGFERTRVQFWLDPAVNKSVHHIEGEGACGTLRIELANNVAPSDGRASLLTAMSILRAVRNRSATLRV